MTASSSPLRPYRAVIMLGGIVLATATLYWAQKVLIPLALAVLLAFVLNPVVTVVQRRGLGRVPSVILVACLSFLLLGGIGLALTLQVKRLVAELPQYRQNVVQKVAGLREVGQGRWLQDVEEMLKERYKAGGYLIAPRLSVELVTTRPWYIVGEVARVGQFPYVDCLHVIQAIAIAGGFTRRASKSNITIKRFFSKTSEEEYVTEDTLVEPGDVLRVPERWF